MFSWSKSQCQSQDELSKVWAIEGSAGLRDTPSKLSRIPADCLYRLHLSGGTDHHDKHQTLCQICYENSWHMEKSSDHYHHLLGSISIRARLRMPRRYASRDICAKIELDALKGLRVIVFFLSLLWHIHPLQLCLASSREFDDLLTQPSMAVEKRPSQWKRPVWRVCRSLADEAKLTTACSCECRRLMMEHSVPFSAFPKQWERPISWECLPKQNATKLDIHRTEFQTLTLVSFVDETDISQDNPKGTPT